MSFAIGIPPPAEKRVLEKISGQVGDLDFFLEKVGEGKRIFKSLTYGDPPISRGGEFAQRAMSQRKNYD